MTSRKSSENGLFRDPNREHPSGIVEEACPYCGGPLTSASRTRIAKVEADLKVRIAREVAKAGTQASAAIERAKREAARAAEASVASRLRTQREESENKLTKAVAAERVRAYEERMRLDAQLSDLQRRLQSRTAGALGDEGEVDLLALLQSEFPDDEIGRVAKGVRGPDIVHRITGCGSVIIYDSKNHKTWASRWTAKLRDDMKLVSPAADHAVLVVSPMAFPKGEHHGLVFRDGVMIATATRVIPIVHLMRRQVIQSHALRLSSDQRDEKTTRLYLLLTSNRIGDLWQRHSEALHGLLEIERSDERHQGRVRAQRVELVNGLRSMIHDDLVKKIDDIMSGLADEGSL